MHGTASGRLFVYMELAAPAGGGGLQPGTNRYRPGVYVVALADLSVGYSPRQIRLDRDHVAALVEVVDRIPPVVVDERTMTVIDGLHRLEAVRRAGRSEIRALFFQGNETEAMALAVQSNVKHGKPLSRSERQEAARELLSRCPERSDRWLGEICGLSHATVARLRQASQAAGVGVRTGRDGRRRPVDPVPGQAAVLKVLEGDPAASARQAAGAAGVAPSTAQRVAAVLRGRQKLSPPSTPPVAGRGPFHAALEGPAFRSSPELAKAASWLVRTAVAPEDFHAYLESVPLGRVYEVVDECRRRSRTWAELAEALEKLARSGGRHPAG